MMKINQLRGIVVVGVLWLCLSAGCKKDPPPEPICDRGCCFDNIDVRFAAKLEGVPLKSLYDSGIIVFNEPVIDSKLPANDCFPKEVYGGLICQVDEQAYNDYIIKIRSDPDYRKQQYKVWGALYEAYHIIPFQPCTKTYVVKVERIEKLQ